MLSRIFAFSAVAMCAAIPFSAQAQTLQLEPTSDWKLREYDDKCRVSRVFGEGENQTTLWIDQGSVGQLFNITLIGRPFRNAYGPRITMAFTPGEARSRGYVSSTSSKGRPVIASFGVPAISFEQLTPRPTVAADGTTEEIVDLLAGRASEFTKAEVLQGRYEAIESLDVSGALLQQVSLLTGEFLPVLSQLRSCKSKLKQKRQALSSDSSDLSRRATPVGQGQWAAKIQANYPYYLIREKKEGTVWINVQVSPEGRVSFCEVSFQSGDPGFNNSACLAMMRHARYEPALDANGVPRWDSLKTSITYRLN